MAVLIAPRLPRSGDREPLLPVAARSDFCYGPDQKTLLHQHGESDSVSWTVTALDISASDIRPALRRGQSIRYLVPPAVERYLSRQRLYRRGRRRS